MPESRSSPLPPKPTLRRFLTRAEAAILMGMVAVISSLFLTWRVQKPELLSTAFPLGAVHIENLSVQHNGFGANCAAPLTLCAALCACTLMWDITPKNRLALSAAGGAGAFACVIIALTRFALLPGVILGLVGGGLLLFGVVDRYQRAEGVES